METTTNILGQDKPGKVEARRPTWSLKRTRKLQQMTGRANLLLPYVHRKTALTSLSVTI